MVTLGCWLLWDYPQFQRMVLEDNVAITEGEIWGKVPHYLWLWQVLEKLWVAAATSVTQESLCGTREPQVKSENPWETGLRSVLVPTAVSWHGFCY